MERNWPKFSFHSVTLEETIKQIASLSDNKAFQANYPFQDYRNPYFNMFE